MVRLWITKSVADTRGHWFEPGKPAQLPDEEAAVFIENGMAITELDFALGLLKHHEFTGFLVNDDTSDEFRESVLKAGYSIEEPGTAGAQKSESGADKGDGDDPEQTETDPDPEPAPEKPPAKKPSTRKPSTRKTTAKKSAE